MRHVGAVPTIARGRAVTRCSYASPPALGVSYPTFLLMMQVFPELPLQFQHFLDIIPEALLDYFLNAYLIFRDYSSARQ